MTSSWNNETLKAFIKETLGCGRPDQVFRKIEIGKHRVKGYLSELSRIVVGDTLLIYITRPAADQSFEDCVHIIATAGKAGRDSNHYNRFRLVVTTGENTPVWTTF